MASICTFETASSKTFLSENLNPQIYQSQIMELLYLNCTYILQLLVEKFSLQMATNIGQTDYGIVVRLPPVWTQECCYFQLNQILDQPPKIPKTDSKGFLRDQSLAPSMKFGQKIIKIYFPRFYPALQYINFHK